MYPRPRYAVGCLKGADFVVALHCQCDFIETFKQSDALARINLKTMSFPRG
jgi:hypothetical protein